MHWRLTMACSRVVIMDWGEEYARILKEAGLTIKLFKIYVDDVRQASTILKMGSRFYDKSKSIVETEEARVEDEVRKKEGESPDARMVRVLTPAMNAINPDLVFTTELREDFMDMKLPTLDFKMWYEDDWSINHTYYEKEMRSQLMIQDKERDARETEVQHPEQ